MMAGSIHCATRIAILLLLCLTTSRVRGSSDEALDKAILAVDARVAAEMDAAKIGGCTVGIVVGRALVWCKSYGLADIEAARPAANDDVYRIGSITKQFTGLMVVKLVYDGKLRWSDPVAKYFSEFASIPGRPADAPPVTMIQLATMTGGLAREPRNLPRYLNGSVSEWESVLISALSETRYDFEPDTRYHYSNIGYAVLGVAAARAARQPYVEYVDHEILVPLGMTSTAFEPNDSIRKRLSRGYGIVRGSADSSAPDREHAGRGYKVPNGAMYTTAGDLAKFLAFELGHGPDGVLPPDELSAHFDRVQSSDAQLRRGYGVGFSISRRGSRVMIGHGGSVAGYRAAAYINRETDTGVVVLRNVGGGPFNAGRVCQDALELVAASRDRVSDDGNP